MIAKVRRRDERADQPDDGDHGEEHAAGTVEDEPRPRTGSPACESADDRHKPGETAADDGPDPVDGVGLAGAPRRTEGQDDAERGGEGGHDAMGRH